MTLYYGRDLDPDELREQMLDTLRLRYIGCKCPVRQNELYHEMRALTSGRHSVHHSEKESRNQ